MGSNQSWRTTLVYSVIATAVWVVVLMRGEDMSTTRMLLVAPFLIGIALLLWQLLRWATKSAQSS